MHVRTYRSELPSHRHRQVAPPRQNSDCTPQNNAHAHRPAGEQPDSHYPYFFTTGRFKEHYNSGAQTRKVDKLTATKPAPVLQVHPSVAGRHGLTVGAVVAVESRRGRAEFRVEVTPDIRPDTLFAPFHWGGREMANNLTNAALDPVSRMPEFKLAAVRIVSARANGETTR